MVVHIASAAWSWVLGWVPLVVWVVGVALVGVVGCVFWHKWNWTNENEFTGKLNDYSFDRWIFDKYKVYAILIRLKMETIKGYWIF